MPPKKFQSLSDFLDEQPKDPNLVPSPYGGYFRKRQTALNRFGSRVEVPVVVVVVVVVLILGLRS